ncbi:MAG: alanine racemase [Candidatus Latescibacteria bacterium]|nr:alanine racemase [Candidatus Latescibacterota bacterium]
MWMSIYDRSPVHALPSCPLNPENSMTASPFDAIETPNVLLDQTLLRANIDQMQDKAQRHGVRLRPHIKTHKSLAIGQLQMDRGACGITAAKVDEALVFAQAGVASVTLAQPLLTAAKLDRLLGQCGSLGTDLRLIVDSRAGLDLLEARAGQLGTEVGVFLKIDVGLHRCGLAEDNGEIDALAARIEAAAGLRWCGLLAHAGHAYGAANADQVRQIAAQERRILLTVRDRLQKQGLPVPELSVGSTPTVLAAEGFSGLTEIRPGNYVFMDHTPLRLGLIEPQQIALTVLATIISKNDEYFITDAGSKTLTSDQGAHGLQGAPGYGTAYAPDDFAARARPLIVAKLSEEHGFVGRGGVDLPLGSRLRIVPNHSCPVANLAGSYCLVNGDQVGETWPVEAACLSR